MTSHFTTTETVT